jgi:hypothetical protein
VNTAAALDHLVVAADDVETLGTFYTALGFQVGATNTHPWGTQNKIIQFDRHFIELIALPEDAPSVSETSSEYPFAGYLREYLRWRQGCAMFVRTTDDAPALHAVWRQTGLGAPGMLHFERLAVGPDGTPVRVAFSLAFARSSADTQGFGFFACQHHEPGNFWIPTRQVHQNAVTGVRKTVFVSDTPADTAAFLAEAMAADSAHGSSDGMSKLAIDGSELAVLTRDLAAQTYGVEAPAAGIFAIHFATRDLAAMKTRIAEMKLVSRELASGAVAVHPQSAFGSTLVFETEAVVRDA